MKAISTYIFSRHSYEFDNFNKSIEEYTFVLNGKEKFLTFCRMTLLVIYHNLNDKEWKAFCLELKDIIQTKFRDADKMIRMYTEKFYKNLEIKITKSESPDFEIILPDGTKQGVEVTKLIDSTDAVINKISQENFGSGRTSQEILNQSKKKYPNIFKNVTIGKFNSKEQGLYITSKCMKDISQEHINYSHQIRHKYLLFEEWSKNKYFNSRVILCIAYSPISLTNKMDFDEIANGLFQHEDCWGSINLNSKEIIIGNN